MFENVLFLFNHASWVLFFFFLTRLKSCVGGYQWQSEVIFDGKLFGDLKRSF